MGMLCGVQAGLWRVKAVYGRVDPTGSRLTEVRSLMDTLRHTTSKEDKSTTKKTNKYGDPVE